MLCLDLRDLLYNMMQALEGSTAESSGFLSSGSSFKRWKNKTISDMKQFYMSLD